MINKSCFCLKLNNGLDFFLPTEGELSFEDEGALVLPARRGAFVNGLSTVPLVSFKASCTLEEDREEDEDFFDA